LVAGKTKVTQPTRHSTKPEIDDETRRIIERRLATADREPKKNAWEAIEEIRRTLKQGVPR
jgi:hypothetical protein